jgi:hypothetical protein
VVASTVAAARTVAVASTVAASTVAASTVAAASIAVAAITAAAGTAVADPGRRFGLPLAGRVFWKVPKTVGCCRAQRGDRRLALAGGPRR